jgi:RNA polymerase sigma-70 factor (ECF subfamily)
MTQEAEAVLIAKAQQDPSAFKEIYRLYIDRIFYYVLSRSDRRADAEDITAQAFLEALESLPNYQHRGHFTAWLFTIVRHRIADFYREKLPERAVEGRDLPEHEEGLLVKTIQQENLRRLQLLLAHLPEGERELLRLRFAGELKFSEIAVLLGRKESAVKMSFYRLLGRLQSQMEVRDA